MGIVAMPGFGRQMQVLLENDECGGLQPVISARLGAGAIGSGSGDPGTNRLGGSLE